jgi:AcrR family transcriptional regulator
MAKKESTSPALNADHIVKAALALIDAQGLEALTMRRLGQSLGVEAMAIYHHLPSRDALLDAIAELLESESLGWDCQDWRSSLSNLYERQLATAAKHPRAIGLMTARSSPNSATKNLNAQVQALLMREGLAKGSALRWLRVLAAYINGAASYCAALSVFAPACRRDAAADLRTGYSALLDAAAAQMRQPLQPANKSQAKAARRFSRSAFTPTHSLARTEK